MLYYVARRILFAIPIALGVTVICFGLIYLAPGDPLQSILPPDATQADVAYLTHVYGFDRPIPIQYLKWLARALTGDLGTSIQTNRPVFGDVMHALGNTLVISVGATLVAFPIAFGLGTLAAQFAGRAADRIATGIAVLGVSVPNYWLGIVLIIVFAVELGVLPATGMGPQGSDRFDVTNWQQLKFAVLPVATTALVPLGIITRSTRAAVADVLGQDFIHTLQAKGLGRIAILRHATRNALPQILAVMGLQFGYLVGGSILIETIFTWPGTGFMLSKAILTRDIPLLQGAMLVLALCFVLINLVVDLLQTAADPRVKRSWAGGLDIVTDLTLDAVATAGAPGAPATKVRGYWRGVARRLRYDYVTLFFLGVVLLIALAALLAPWIAPLDPNKTSMAYRLKPVGFRQFFLGTDELGRDMLSRLIWGGRMSLMMGLIPVTLACMIGGLLGIVAGFFGGWVNTLIMRTMDVFYAFPSVLLAVAISGTMGGGVANGMIALTLVFVPPLCRVAETVTTQIRGLDFVEAARASGASMMSIIFGHVLGNAISPIFVYASSLISVSILLAAGLSFLGLGVQPPTADWGQMLSTLRNSIYVQPLVCALPGVAILITSLSFNLVGDGLRQAMDVRG